MSPVANIDPPGPTAMANASGNPMAPGPTLGMLSDRSSQVRFGVAGVAIFTVLAALSTEDGPVLCPIRRCSGGYCPGCGMTRSGGRLLRGDVAGSWEQHPYLLLAVAQLIVLGGLWTAGSRRVKSALISRGRTLLMANLALMGVIWVARMTNGSIPIPFFN